VDLNTSAEQVVGMHDEAIKCVEHCPQSGKNFWLMGVIRISTSLYIILSFSLLGICLQQEKT